MIKYENNSDTFIDMSVQYETVQCLQLKYMPRKETSKEYAYGHLFLFSIVAGNDKFLKSACSQN